MIKPVQLFKCLSDDTRLHACILIATEGELCVCELMEALDDSQPKISRHLAQLRSSGILDDSRRGQWVYYAIAKDLPQWARDIIHIAGESKQAILQQFQDNLRAMKNRPQCC